MAAAVVLSDRGRALRHPLRREERRGDGLGDSVARLVHPLVRLGDRADGLRDRGVILPFAPKADKRHRVSLLLGRKAEYHLPG